MWNVSGHIIIFKWNLNLNSFMLVSNMHVMNLFVYPNGFFIHVTPLNDIHISWFTEMIQTSGKGRCPGNNVYRDFPFWRKVMLLKVSNLYRHLISKVFACVLFLQYICIGTVKYTKSNSSNHSLDVFGPGLYVCYLQLIKRSNVCSQNQQPNSWDKPLSHCLKVCDRVTQH